MKTFDSNGLFMTDNQLNNFVDILKEFYYEEVLNQDFKNIDDKDIAFFYLISYIFTRDKIEYYLDINDRIFDIHEEIDSLSTNHQSALLIAYKLLNGEIGIVKKEDIPEEFESLVLHAIDILLSEYETSLNKKIELIILTSRAIQNNIVKLLDDEFDEEISNDNDFHYEVER